MYRHPTNQNFRQTSGSPMTASAASLFGQGMSANHDNFLGQTSTPPFSSLPPMSNHSVAAPSADIPPKIPSGPSSLENKFSGRGNPFRSGKQRGYRTPGMLSNSQQPPAMMAPMAPPNNQPPIPQGNFSQPQTQTYNVNFQNNEPAQFFQPQQVTSTNIQESFPNEPQIYNVDQGFKEYPSIDLSRDKKHQIEEEHKKLYNEKLLNRDANLEKIQLKKEEMIARQNAQWAEIDEKKKINDSFTNTNEPFLLTTQKPSSKEDRKALRKRADKIRQKKALQKPQSDAGSLEGLIYDISSRGTSLCSDLSDNNMLMEDLTLSPNVNHQTSVPPDSFHTSTNETFLSNRDNLTNQNRQPFSDSIYSHPNVESQKLPSDNTVSTRASSEESSATTGSTSMSSFGIVSANSSESESRLSPYQIVENNSNSTDISPIDMQNVSTSSATFEKVQTTSTASFVANADNTNIVQGNFNTSVLPTSSNNLILKTTEVQAKAASMFEAALQGKAISPSFTKSEIHNHQQTSQGGDQKHSVDFFGNVISSTTNPTNLSNSSNTSLSFHQEYYAENDPSSNFENNYNKDAHQSSIKSSVNTQAINDALDSELAQPSYNEFATTETHQPTTKPFQPATRAVKPNTEMFTQNTGNVLQYNNDASSFVSPAPDQESFQSSFLPSQESHISHTQDNLDSFPREAETQNISSSKEIPSKNFSKESNIGFFEHSKTENTNIFNPSQSTFNSSTENSSTEHSYNERDPQQLEADRHISDNNEAFIVKKDSQNESDQTTAMHNEQVMSDATHQQKNNSAFNFFAQDSMVNPPPNTAVTDVTHHESNMKKLPNMIGEDAYFSSQHSNNHQQNQQINMAATNTSETPHMDVIQQPVFQTNMSDTTTQNKTNINEQFNNRTNKSPNSLYETPQRDMTVQQQQNIQENMAAMSIYSTSKNNMVINQPLSTKTNMAAPTNNTLQDDSNKYFNDQTPMLTQRFPSNIKLNDSSVTAPNELNSNLSNTVTDTHSQAEHPQRVQTQQPEMKQTQSHHLHTVQPQFMQVQQTRQHPHIPQESHIQPHFKEISPQNPQVVQTPTQNVQMIQLQQQNNMQQSFMVQSQPQNPPLQPQNHEMQKKQHQQFHMMPHTPLQNSQVITKQHQQPQQQPQQVASPLPQMMEDQPQHRQTKTQPQQPPMMGQIPLQQPRNMMQSQPQQPQPVSHTQSQQPQPVSQIQPQQPQLASQTQPQQPHLASRTQPQQLQPVLQIQPQQPHLASQTQPQQPHLASQTQPQQPHLASQTQPQQPQPVLHRQSQHQQMPTQTPPSAQPPVLTQQPPIMGQNPSQQPQTMSQTQPFQPYMEPTQPHQSQEMAGAYPYMPNNTYPGYQQNMYHQYNPEYAAWYDQWYQYQQYYSGYGYQYPPWQNSWAGYDAYSYTSSAASSTYGGDDSRPASVIERRSISSDNVLSELEDITSELSFSRRPATPPPEEIIQRTTPLSFTRPHLIASFSKSGGLINIVLPKQPLDGEVAFIQSIKLEGILPIQDLKRFPGPLVRGDTSKKKVLNFINDTTNNILTQKYAEHELFAVRALWEFVAMLIKQNGTFVGSDVAEMLLHMLPTIELEDGTETKNLISSINMPQFVSPHQMEEFQLFVVSGRLKDALDHSIHHHNWGQAFMLASCMGDKYASLVQNKFLQALKSSDPLKTLLSHMNNKDTTFIKKCANSKDWVQHFCVLVSHSCGDRKRDVEKIIEFGDILKEKGDIAAAHLAYLVADTPASNDKIHLIGLDHERFRGKRINVINDSLSVQLTEIYQYAKRLHNPSFTIASFQEHLLHYGLQIMEYGYPSQALAYLESISHSIISDSTNCLYDRGFCYSVSQNSHQILLQDVEDYNEKETPPWLAALDTYITKITKSSHNDGDINLKKEHSEQLNEKSTDEIRSNRYSTDVSGGNQNVNVDNDYTNVATDDHNQVSEYSQDYVDAPTLDKNIKEDDVTKRMGSSYGDQPGASVNTTWDSNYQQYDQQQQQQVPKYYQPSSEYHPSSEPSAHDSTPNISTSRSGFSNDSSSEYDPSQSQQSYQFYEQQQSFDYQSQIANQMDDFSQYSGGNIDQYPGGNIDQQPQYAKEEMEEEDLFGGFKKKKPSEANGKHSNQNKKPLDTKAGSKSGKDKQATPSKKGWFGGIISKITGSKEAYLPDDKDKSLYFDKTLGRWVDKNADEEEVKKPPPPPPTGHFSAKPSVATPSVQPPSSRPRSDVSSPQNYSSASFSSEHSSMQTFPSSDYTDKINTFQPNFQPDNQSGSNLNQSQTFSTSNVEPSSEGNIPPAVSTSVSDVPERSKAETPAAMRRRIRREQQKTLLDMSKAKAATAAANENESEKPAGPPSRFSLKAAGGSGRRGRYVNVMGGASGKATSSMKPFMDPMTPGKSNMAPSTPGQMNFFNPAMVQPSPSSTQ